MLLAALALLLAGSEVQTLEGEGRAPATLGATRATAAARDAALRNIVLAACRQLVAADPAIVACALDEDAALAEFEGLVKNQQVVSEKTADGVVTVRLRADVSLQAVTTHELEARRLLARLTGRKLGIGVVEQHLDQRGAVAGSATYLSTKLGVLFRADGFQLFPMDSLDGKDVDAAVAVGKRDGLDLMIVGLMKSVEQPMGPGDEERDDRGYPVRVRWRVVSSGHVLLIEPSTGLLLSEVNIEQTESTLSGPDYASTRKTWLESRAPGVWRALRADLLKHLRKLETAGSQVFITLDGAKTDAQVKDLANAVSLLPGVRSVSNDAPDGGTATVTVVTGATAKELAAAISKKLKRRVSISGVKGSSISGTLAK